METDGSTSYDEIPYNDNCFPYTHPDYLATIGKLFGLTPAPVERCRVLELGCAGGGNLIPMALELPEARFVGIDLSTRQVGAGLAVVEQLGLHNIDLKAMSIADVDEQFGLFDYIVCHGVYSWVPAPVRDKILEICSRRLSPDGIAYISYNTYPGWHARGMVREMLAFHVRGLDAAMDRVRKAREFLDDLVRVLPDQSSSYARILRTEGEFLRGVANSYLYHEHLEETNHPVYFREFADRAAAVGLRYLAEARTPGLIEDLPPEASEALDAWAEDEKAAEQYLDFLTNRTFRRTLLCHADRERSRYPSPDEVSSLWIGTNVAPTSPEVDVVSDSPERFCKPDGVACLTTNNPLIKAAFVELFEARPRALAFETLWERVQSRLGHRDDSDRAVLRRSMLRCFLSNLVELHVHPPVFSMDVAEQPLASPLARIQAVESDRVTNLRRRTVELGEFDRVVLRQLDGHTVVPTILESLIASFASGAFTFYRGDEPVQDLGEVREILLVELEACLHRLAGLALLVN